MFIKAKDHDGRFSSDDDLDDIFINQSQEPNTGYSQLAEYRGNNKRVTVRFRYRIDCQINYYGRNCATFCEAQNDGVNGHYTCNSTDGSVQCRAGYENPGNNCKDSKLAAHATVHAKIAIFNYYDIGLFHLLKIHPLLRNILRILPPKHCYLAHSPLGCN